MAEYRFCAFDDQPVREMQKSDKEWGKGENAAGYIHDSGGADGIPSCGRRVLVEHETYVEGGSGYERTDEPQLT